MRILAVTNIYPTVSHPASGTFVEQQVMSLRTLGVDVRVLFVDLLKQGMTAYLRVPALMKSTLAEFDADVVHAMYGGVLADVVTRVVKDRPTIVTFHGSDLHGEQLAGNVRKWFAAYGVLSSKRAARRARGIVVVARGLQAMLPFGIRAQVQVIPCGIDLDRFKPLDQSACRRKVNWSDGQFHVLFN